MSKLYSKQIAYGLTPPLFPVGAAPVQSPRDPTTNDNYPVGQLWNNYTLNTVWMLSSYTGGLPIWTELDNTGAITGIVWTTEAGAAVDATVNHGYVLANAGPTTLRLPAVSIVGAEIHIIGQGANPWIISQRANQTVRLTYRITTAGAVGTTTAAHAYATAVLVCRVANLVWEITDTNDNLNLA